LWFIPKSEGKRRKGNTYIKRKNVKKKLEERETEEKN
jgi:hypothetical protein